jgi:hypothetical protein
LQRALQPHITRQPCNQVRPWTAALAQLPVLSEDVMRKFFQSMFGNGWIDSFFDKSARRLDNPDPIEAWVGWDIPGHPNLMIISAMVPRSFDKGPAEVRVALEYADGTATGAARRAVKIAGALCECVIVSGACCVHIGALLMLLYRTSVENGSVCTNIKSTWRSPGRSAAAYSDQLGLEAKDCTVQHLRFKDIATVEAKAAADRKSDMREKRKAEDEAQLQQRLGKIKLPPFHDALAVLDYIHGRRDHLPGQT